MMTDVGQCCPAIEMVERQIRQRCLVIKIAWDRFAAAHIAD